jgi:hypothetical protein
MNKNEAKNILLDFLDFCDQYQLDDEALDHFIDQIYELWDQPCGISLEEASKEFGFP